MKIWNDQLLTMDALYRLSYNGTLFCSKLSHKGKTTTAIFYHNYFFFSRASLNSCNLAFSGLISLSLL